jgi:hypothetical protein
MQVSGVLGMSRTVYTRRKMRRTNVYHTDKDCSHFQRENTPIVAHDEDELRDCYTECQYCSGEYPGGGSTETPIAAKLKDMDASEVGT